MSLEIQGIDHVYVTVSDIERSAAFYDPIMLALGFRKGNRSIAGEPHVHYFNRVLQYTLRPAHGADPGVADPYRVGSLHHLCFRVAGPKAVDDAHARLTAVGVMATAPALHPDYRPDYYATFFSDPDGIRLEIVCDTEGRRLIRRRYDELVEFVDPVPKLLEREANSPRSKLARVASIRDDGVPPNGGERFDRLLRCGNTIVERIVSSSTPATGVQRQEHDEWVMLVSGTATLDLAGDRVELAEGDHVLIPAGSDHRVLATSEGATWIAVHMHG